MQKVVGFPHMECISSNTALAQAEINLVSMVARELRLKDAIEELVHDRERAGLGYDYIFIDWSTEFGLLTIIAVAAAEELLIPIQMRVLRAGRFNSTIGNVFRCEEKVES
ncbi:MAG: AAA family ATPase [Actinomycetota bacterium]